MTQVAAIAMSLLKGDVLSIMNGFQLFNCTNLPRELSRSIEQKFGVEISRERVEFVSKYGQAGYYFRYRLNKTPYNAPGIHKMRDYVREHLPSVSSAKTEKEATRFKQQELFFNQI